MASYTDLVKGQLASFNDIQQIINSLSARANIPASLKTTDPVAFSIQAYNTDPAGRAMVLYGADGATVLLQVDATGVKVSPDGTAAVVPGIKNSGHFTAMTIDTGGVGVLAGNLGIGTAPIPQTGVLVSETINSSGGAANAANLIPTLVAQAANDVLRGINVAPTYNDNAFANVGHVSIVVESQAGLPGGTHLSAYFGANPVAINPAGSPMLAGGGSPATVDLRLGNARNIGWMNAASSDWIPMQFDGSNRLSIGGPGTSAAAVGAGNGASTNVQANAHGTGTGPANPLQITFFRPEVYNNTIYWVPLMQ